MAELYWPTDPSNISYGFGYPPGYGGYHNGIDFRMSQSTPLIATAAGTIRNVNAGIKDGWGVDIMTPDGWKVRAWHVTQFLLPHGSRVNPGDIIGLSGGAKGTPGAGNSTGPHLHWGVAVDGRDRWVDPAGLNPQIFNPNPPPPPPVWDNEDMYILSVEGRSWLVGKGYCAKIHDHYVYTRMIPLYGQAYQLIDTDDWNRLTWTLGIPADVRQNLINNPSLWACWDAQRGYFIGSGA